MILEPNTDRTILATAGEQKVLEVMKHPIACTWPIASFIWGFVLMALTWAYPTYFWVLIILSVGFTTYGYWRILAEFRDRFVITNQRIIRISGVVATDRASIPLSRLIDITVKKPLLGRWPFSYGHFIFESAAQVQGLNEIRYVKDVDDREILLRKVMGGGLPAESELEDDGT